MQEIEAEKNRVNSRLSSIESELSEASRAISNSENQVNSLDASIGGLSSRLAAVRGRGYCALSHLDKTIEILSKRWSEVGPAVRQSVSASLQPLNPQIQSLQSQAQSARREVEMGNIPAGEMAANRLGPEASSVKSNADREAAQATAPIRDMSGGLAAVERDLKIAETTVALFSEAAFPMKEGETPVLAVGGKLMEGEKPHGTLYFTNQRFVFEGQKEVVLEKKLFIVTKKRMERVVMTERPIGAVKEISKGRVGLIAGTGVFVEFRPEVGIPLMPYDVAAWEADVITRFYRYITGGEADRDIATVRGVAPPATATIHLVRCSACGAPHSGEIYQGQTSVNCEYCGTAVAIA
jgi:prefoldin subunit 5